jgi:hypothetical protein
LKDVRTAIVAEKRGVMVATITGVVLIVVGIAMVIFQMSKVSWARPPSRTAKIGPKGIELKTTYPGLIVIAIGAVMVMVGTATSN